MIFKKRVKNCFELFFGIVFFSVARVSPNPGPREARQGKGSSSIAQARCR
jgi:hypothetical protein